tara:strand:- start:1340 stop:1618 length:279 start_codon:yes stop_codon:yes gene_type:complete
MSEMVEWLVVGDLVELADKYQYVGDFVNIDRSPGLLVSFVSHRGDVLRCYDEGGVARDTLGANDTALILWPDGRLSPVNTIFLRKASRGQNG